MTDIEIDKQLKTWYCLCVGSLIKIKGSEVEFNRIACNKNYEYRTRANRCQ